MRTLVDAVWVGIFIVVGQFFYFASIISTPVVLDRTDAIMVFQGMDGRVEVAYQLAAEGVAPTLIISPASERLIRFYNRLYQPELIVNAIVEEKARSTFENALFASRIIKQNHLHSVILVTSWNHMPRSNLLLKLMLADSNTRIIPFPVATGRLDHTNWYRYRTGWKMVYNEMVETWGSAIEGVRFWIRDDIPYTQQGKSSMFSQLKRYLLFDIDQREMALDRRE